jgi:NADP-dependent 3-hydroxy acid dehydrogenase YdfG
MVSKVIIVTGASRGIGLAVANHLLNASHNVVLVSRSQQALQDLKDRFPSQVQYLAADLTVLDVRNPVTLGLGKQHKFPIHRMRRWD